MDGIDGSYKPLLSVFGQRKHGQKKETVPHSEDEMHVLLTATCPSGVLNAMPANSEKLEHQTQCLSDALADGSNKMLVIFSDMPSMLDSPHFHATFCGCQFVAKDLVHIPLKVEQAAEEKKTELTVALRRCVWKLIFAMDDGCPYFRLGQPVQDVLLLHSAMSVMSDRCAQQRIRKIKEANYTLTAHEHINEFIMDAAVLAKKKLRNVLR